MPRYPDKPQTAITVNVATQRPRETLTNLPILLAPTLAHRLDRIYSYYQRKLGVPTDRTGYTPRVPSSGGGNRGLCVRFLLENC